MNVTVEFQYTRKELLNALNEVYFNRTLIIPVLAIVFAFIGFLFSQTDFYYFRKPFLSGAVILIVACILVLYVIPNRIYENEPKYKSKYILTFSHDYIQGTVGDLEFKAEWGYFKRARESKGFYFLLYGKDVPLIIPKRAFPSRVQEQVFRDIAQEKLGKIQKR